MDLPKALMVSNSSHLPCCKGMLRLQLVQRRSVWQCTRVQCVMTALMCASSGVIPRAELNRLLSSSDPISWRRSDSCLGWRWCYEEQDNAVTSGLKSMLRALASPPVLQLNYYQPKTYAS